MPLISLAIPPGVVRSATDGASSGRWWDANLVRWRGPRLLPIGGWERITPAALPSTPRKVLAWRDLSDIRRIAYHCDDHIVVEEGSIYTDHTPDDYGGDATNSGIAGFGIGLYGVDTFGTPRTQGNPRLYERPGVWSMDTFGEDLLLCASSDGRLLRLSPGGPAATKTREAPPAAGAPKVSLPPQAEVIANAPKNNQAMIVTEERHVMLFGMAANPRRIGWCSREDFNDWDFASVTNTAGFIDLDIGGWIVNAVKVRGGILVFTDTEVWLGRYRGMPFVYGFERIGKACGILAPHSFAASAGVCVWMAQEGFWIFDGGTVRTLACDVEDFVYSTLDPRMASFRSHASANGRFSEFWFHYPSAGQTECDRYVIWSYQSNTPWWSIGSLPRTAMADAGVYPYPIMTTMEGMAFQHESGWRADGHSRIGEIFAESGALSTPNGENFMHVTQGQLDSGAGPQALDMIAYTRETRDGPETAMGPYVPRDDGYIDLDIAGRDIRVRLRNRVDGPFTVGTMRWDVRKGGKR